jgi:hypothetical protein
MTEKNLAPKAGHLELLTGGKKDRKKDAAEKARKKDAAEKAKAKKK